MKVLRWLLLLACLAVLCRAQWPPSPAADAFSSARAFFKQGKFTEAAAAYRAIVSQDHPPGHAYAGLVRSYLKADDVKAADESSLQGLAALPDSPHVHAARGDVLFRKGLIEEAEGEYRAALKLDEGCARAWLGLGRLSAVTSRKTQAFEAFTRAHNLDPDDSDIVFRWAVTLPYPQNVTELDKFIASYHSDPEDERHKREYLELIRALAGRSTWILVRQVPSTELKLETILSSPNVVRGAGLRIRLNNSKDAMLLLDTGASGVIISRKLAEKIGARKLSAHTLEGLGDAGPTEGYIAWVDKIKIGELEFKDCSVLVSTRGNDDTDGTIGADVFSRYLVTIDFPAHRVRLGPLPGSDPPGKSQPPAARDSGPSSTPYFGFGHLLLLPTHVEITASGLFAVDTGAATNFISPGLAGRVSRLHESHIVVRGISGEVKQVQTIENALLEFSHMRQPDENLLTVDFHSLSKDLETELSGLIGYSTLNRMKVIINYRDGTVRFE